LDVWRLHPRRRCGRCRRLQRKDSHQNERNNATHNFPHTKAIVDEPFVCVIALFLAHIVAIIDDQE
jgi:hypothetical protein